MSSFIQVTCKLLRQVHILLFTVRTNVELNPAELIGAQTTVPNFSPSYVSQSPVHIDESMLNPPQIQKVVVEHVIRNESAHSPMRQSQISTFSGRTPKPNGEVDYETWRTQVDLLLSDPSLSDSQKVRIILESLLSPAAEIVKPLGVKSSPSSYLNQIESAFGIVEDLHRISIRQKRIQELFATFLNLNQNAGENHQRTCKDCILFLPEQYLEGELVPPTPVNICFARFVEGAGTRP